MISNKELLCLLNSMETIPVTVPVTDQVSNQVKVLTQPDRPFSHTYEYRLTEKGKCLRNDNLLTKEEDDTIPVTIPVSDQVIIPIQPYGQNSNTHVFGLTIKG